MAGSIAVGLAAAGWGLRRDSLSISGAVSVSAVAGQWGCVHQPCRMLMWGHALHCHGHCLKRAVRH